ncbi:MAG: hypothetical protein KatS3mg076_0781 [Candidatus Binatia bacterium]|nr:MAG: hypothetical protein KatS3mg076_0781 [Candidatus Binatia bacterium]
MPVRALAWVFAVSVCVWVSACGDEDAAVVGVVREEPVPGWWTYGGSQLRTFFAESETRITRSNVASMRKKWRYLTGAVVTASPTVARVDVPGEGRIEVVYVSSWDGNFYALRARDGTRLWSFEMKPHPGASFPQASSAEVVRIGGEERVYVGGGMTVYSFEAATGELRWEFDAGTGCTTCDDETERNEVLSSPTVVEGLVVFGMDVDDREGGKGGLFAVDALDGHLVWYFDVVTGSTCRPFPEDRVRRFDGYHSASELGLPEDFFGTRPGCGFDRTGVGCGNVWSSFAVDRERRFLYIASSNCDTDDDPATLIPPPPMPPYDEAILALDFDGNPVWHWRPREVDNDDLAFGGVPNLFEVRIGGEVREVVGVGNKDGTYYLLDRDGVNELTGRVEPYWRTRVVPGGAIGGIIASAAVGAGGVFFGTAIGESLRELQSPAAWRLRAEDGEVLWGNESALPSFGPTTATREVMFLGNIGNVLVAYDAETGAVLRRFSLGGPVSSAATILDGELFVGEGTGARGGSPAEAAFQQSLVPSAVTAFCLPDSPDCPEELCDDGNVCTYDYRTPEGCASEPAPDTIPCQVPGGAGRCRRGVCEPEGTSE